MEHLYFIGIKIITSGSDIRNFERDTYTSEVYGQLPCIIKVKTMKNEKLNNIKHSFAN